MDEALIQRTAKAATRLLKSKIREHIYTTKNTGAPEGETRWSAMLLVEQGFYKPALLEWQEVLDVWGSDNREAISKVINDSFAPAASDVLSIFDEDQVWPMRKIIEQYHRTFSADDLLKGA